MIFLFLLKEMDHAKWREMIGASASIWTILQMLSPIPTCFQFFKKQSVGDMIVTPYIVAATSCTIWLIYGILVRDTTIVEVNIIGSALQFGYTICFYMHCAKKAQVKKQIALGLLTISGAILYCAYEDDLERLISALGRLCCLITVIFFASPLANMHFVLKTWNSESLPRLLIYTSFMVSLQWTIYGFVSYDTFIIVTNLSGAVLSVVQILLICIIPRDSKNQKVSSTV